MKRYLKYGLLLMAVLAFAGLALAQTGYIIFDQGRKNLTVYSGGTVTVASGGILDVASGGALKIAGTQITPTAAQYNFLAGVTAGTVLASKAVVAGTARDINYVAINDTAHVVSGLVRIATGSTIDIESGGYFKVGGTAVTSTAAELNTVDVTTAGVAEASKALILGATKNVDTIKIKKLGLTAVAAMTDTAGMIGPTMFTFTGDTLYVYKADHTIIAIQ